MKEHTMNDYTPYLREAITRWYRNAEMDYGIIGRWIGARENGSGLEIYYEEDGERMTYTVAWYKEYTPEQVYNIWMEQP
jgi:hypothetical protein